jgi:hypothetical protein
MQGLHSGLPQAVHLSPISSASAVAFRLTCPHCNRESNDFALRRIRVNYRIAHNSTPELLETLRNVGMSCSLWPLYVLLFAAEKGRDLSSSFWRFKGHVWFDDTALHLPKHTHTRTRTHTHNHSLCQMSLYASVSGKVSFNKESTSNFSLQKDFQNACTVQYTVKWKTVPILPMASNWSTNLWSKRWVIPICTHEE